MQNYVTVNSFSNYKYKFTQEGKLERSEIHSHDLFK